MDKKAGGAKPPQGKEAPKAMDSVTTGAKP